jgi:hypothetical protein
MEERLPQYARCAHEIADVLQACEPLQMQIDRAALISRLADENRDMALLSGAALSSLVAVSGPGWTQHGDFTLENLIHRSANSGAPVTIIDWEHAAGGFPPLYDLFSLLISALPAVHAFQGTGDEAWVNGFEDSFFRPTSWCRLFKRCLESALAANSLPTGDLWPLFCGFLLLRFEHFRGRGMAPAHDAFIRIAASHERSFLLH